MSLNLFFGTNGNKPLGFTLVFVCHPLNTSSCPQYAGHLLKLTGPTLLDPVSNETGFPLSFTFRRQPTNGDETESRFVLAVPEWKKKRKGIFTYTLTNTLSVFFVLKHVLLHRLKTGWWIYLRCKACPVVSVRWVYGAQLSVQTWSPPLILRLQAVWTLEDDNTRIWHFKVVVCWAVCVTLSEWDFIPVTTWNFPSQRFPRGVTETLTAPLPSLTLTPTWEKITPLLLYYFHYSYLKSGITVFLPYSCNDMESWQAYIWKWC